MDKKKRVFFAVLLSAIMLSAHLTSFAAGWVQTESGEWMYANSDGYYLTDAWVGDYYLDSAGYMLRDSWTADGWWVGSDGLWDSRWGQRFDDVEPWTNKPYEGFYTYTFYYDVYGDGVEHWSAVQTSSLSGNSKTFEMYPAGRSYFMLMDIISADVVGSVSFSPDRSAAYVSLYGEPSYCRIEW